MIVTKDFHSMIEMNKYIEDNSIKSKDIHYMGNYLNVQGCCLVPLFDHPIPQFSLQYENHVALNTSCTGWEVSE